MSVRQLCLTRHAEPDDDGRLTEVGCPATVVMFNDTSHLPDEL